MGKASATSKQKPGDTEKAVVHRSKSRCRTRNFVYAFGASCALLAAWLIRVALSRYEDAIATSHRLREEMSRLAAQLKLTRREMSELEKAKKAAEVSATGVSNETEIWKTALFRASAVLPRTSLLALDDAAADNALGGKARTAASSHSIVVQLMPPFAFAAEVTYHHKAVMECVTQMVCSVGLLDVLSYALRNLLMVAYHIQADGDVDMMQLRAKALWRGRQLLLFVEQFQAKPFVGDESDQKRFLDLLQDLFSFRREFFKALTEAPSSPMRLPASPVEMPLGVRGVVLPIQKDATKKKKSLRALLAEPLASGSQALGIRIKRLTLRVSGTGGTADEVETLVAAMERGWRQIEVPLGHLVAAKEGDEEYNDAVEAAAKASAAASAVASALAATDVTRDKLFFQGVLTIGPGSFARSPADLDAEAVVRAAVLAMNCGHLDLLVLRRMPAELLSSAHWRQIRNDVEGLVEQGLVKSIGIGNVERSQIPEVLRALSEKTARGTGSVQPMMVQNKLSVFFPGHYEEGVVMAEGGSAGIRGGQCILDVARSKNLLFQGYGAADASPGLMELAEDPHVRGVALRYARPPQQVLFRWVLQLEAGLVVETMSPRAVRDAEGALGFAMVSGDMRLLSALSSLRHAVLPLTPSSRSGSFWPEAACVEDLYNINGMLREAASIRASPAS
eukprot:TRINITY_DN55553_c0_g1_i1.p1 TRINITY_DN55553_c0_g1~~TRINITY_DN55553_c0_g1_i1.p1  ORF type:complete len:678 (+),score=114.68 TRINITY_DN55553_c0_g1_i1:129-2162(+)